MWVGKKSVQIHTVALRRWQKGGVVDRAGWGWGCRLTDGGDHHGLHTTAPVMATQALDPSMWLIIGTNVRYLSLSLDIR